MGMQQPYMLYLLHGKTIQRIAAVESESAMNGNLRQTNRITGTVDLHPKLPRSVSDGDGCQTIAGISLYQRKPSASGIESCRLFEKIANAF